MAVIHSDETKGRFYARDKSSIYMYPADQEPEGSKSDSIASAEVWSEQKVLTDPSLFNASIAFVADSQPTWLPIRGKFDTGSDISLVRKEILERAGIEGLTVRIAPVSFGSGIAPAVDHTATEEIDLTWQPNNSSMSFRTPFYVVEEGAFDLLVDNNFIREHDALRNNRSMLFLKNKRRDSGRFIEAILQPIDADLEKPRGIDKQKGERNDELKPRGLKRNGKDLSKKLEHSVVGRSKVTQI